MASGLEFCFHKERNPILNIKTYQKGTQKLRVLLLYAIKITKIIPKLIKHKKINNQQKYLLTHSTITSLTPQEQWRTVSRSIRITRGVWRCDVWRGNIWRSNIGSSIWRSNVRSSYVWGSEVSMIFPGVNSSS